MIIVIFRVRNSNSTYINIDKVTHNCNVDSHDNNMKAYVIPFTSSNGCAQLH